MAKNRKMKIVDHVILLIPVVERVFCRYEILKDIDEGLAISCGRNSVGSSSSACPLCICAFPSVFLQTAQAFHTSALALIDAGTV